VRLMPGYRGKRALDLALITLTAPIWVPLLLVTALLVRVLAGPPVFFRQQRPGLRGRTFELVKFRTMTCATEAGGTLLPDADRMTTLGRFLRRTSLDELPELLNVMRGQMSMVGPRPLLSEYLALYSPSHQRRHDVVPGVTGLAQVSGRNALAWNEKLDLDVEYVERASLRLDLAILFRTLRMVLTGHGVSAPNNVTMPPFTGLAEELRAPPTKPRSPGLGPSE
jgi:sugar transferase EpsL